MTSILLTGASGVIGAALLHRLAGHRVTALTYRAEVPGRAVRGDVTRPWLGLHRGRYAELAASVDVVLHCAGVTDFSADDDTMRTQNVRGTEQIVRFAADAGARLVFSSTAFVARHELARPARAEEPGGTVDPRRYLASKLAAEEVVRRSGLPAAIARISVVIGDSAGGETSRFQGLHSTTSAIMRSLLPVLPFSPGATIDVLPRDLVAEALVALALPPTPSTGLAPTSGAAAPPSTAPAPPSGDPASGYPASTSGGPGPVSGGPAPADRTGPVAEYWITAGAAAPTVQRLVDLVVARCGELGLRVSLPRFAPPAMVERVIRPVFIDPLPAKQRRRFANLMALASLFDGAGRFPTGLGTIPGGPPAPTTALIERAFVASVDYQARTEGLTTAAQVPEQGGLDDGKPMVLKADPA
ncbi:SDR family oxidoreductase [Plantactinospora sp. KLBMP9567]|uniref:SDR family oxidoreductase n=1 Tax=Plantactinospora sp. KLBMP9567 TaxID=3085900 RepID=UPI0029810EAA|nr:SDR family oxidoreductase [Plantactinospora sp. KLBMP9567]MDW5330136.1 SDR family oxidoreductase [Plantactinospora sp. KLBMP9567]